MFGMVSDWRSFSQYLTDIVIWNETHHMGFRDMQVQIEALNRCCKTSYADQVKHHENIRRYHVYVRPYDLRMNY
jgi:hypothetical protein